MYLPQFKTPVRSWISTMTPHHDPAGVGRKTTPGKKWYEEEDLKMKPAPKNWSPRKES